MKKSPLIIGLIGEKGAGKGTVSEYLINNYDAAHFGTSKILKQTIEDLHLPTTRSNFTNLALILKNGFWPSVLIDSLIKDIEEKHDQHSVIIADGIRMHGDVEPFKKKYKKNFYLVYVTADLKLRYERTKKRKEKADEDKATLAQFIEEENRLTEVCIREIGEQADFILTNNTDEEGLKKQIKMMMEKILNES